MSNSSIVAGICPIQQHSSEIKNGPNLTFHQGVMCGGAAFALLPFVESAEVFFWQHRQLGSENWH